jgi:hypothetical protein
MTQDDIIKRAFLTNDMDALVLFLPPLSSRRVLEITFHKTRLERTDIPRHLRHASARWLSDNGFTSLTGRDPWSVFEGDGGE